MSMVSDALKKAQAQATLGQQGLRLDLTGLGGEPPRRRRGMPIVVAAVAVGAMIGVAIPAALYLAPGGDESAEVATAQAAGDAEPAASSESAAQQPAPRDAASAEPDEPSARGPILAVEPFRSGPRDERAGAGASPGLPTPDAEAQLPNVDPRVNPPGPAAGQSPAELAADRSPDAGAAGTEPHTADHREADRPRPALEAGAEYRGVLNVAGQPRLELTGIIWSQFTKIALINGANAEPGDIVDGLRLVEIEPHRIRLRTPDGTEFYLRLR